MVEPIELPKLADANAAKVAAVMQQNGYAPNGLQCPQSITELLDVPNTETKAAVNGLSMAAIKVVCPVCGFQGERYL